MASHGVSPNVSASQQSAPASDSPLTTQTTPECCTARVQYTKAAAAQRSTSLRSQHADGQDGAGRDGTVQQRGGQERMN